MLRIVFLLPIFLVALITLSNAQAETCYEGAVCCEDGYRCQRFKDNYGRCQLGLPSPDSSCNRDHRDRPSPGGNCLNGDPYACMAYGPDAYCVGSENGPVCRVPKPRSTPGRSGLPDYNCQSSRDDGRGWRSNVAYSVSGICYDRFDRQVCCR